MPKKLRCPNKVVELLFAAHEIFGKTPFTMTIGSSSIGFGETHNTGEKKLNEEGEVNKIIALAGCYRGMMNRIKEVAKMRGISFEVVEQEVRESAEFLEAKEKGKKRPTPEIPYDLIPKEEREGEEWKF